VTRRGLTLLLATVLALGLAVGGSAATVPYVALKPGPAYNTLGTVGSTKVISISGAPVHERDGQLDLTTVSVADHLSLFEALAGWLSPSDAVLPREIVFEPDQSEEETQQQNQQEMTESQDAATTAALTHLGYKGTTTVYVASINKGFPADGKLKAGDELLSIDGTPVTSSAQLRKLVSGRSAGETVQVGYLRDGKKAVVTVGTVAAPDETKRPNVGAQLGTRTEFPVKVDITLRDVGGPSAGLMFALGIIDKLGNESLTGGRNIAGTGEITVEGQVGAIGGIAQKMRGAKAVGATVFLSPAENCPEAKDTKPDGITLIKVATLKGALDALKVLRDGGTPPSC
jgi:PDZ domain-containing protein